MLKVLKRIGPVKFIYIILIVGFAVMFLAAKVYADHIIDENTRLYENGEHLMEQGAVIEAYDCFSRLGTWRDAEEKAAIAKREVDFNAAVQYMAEEEYYTALKLLIPIEDHENAEACIKACIVGLASQYAKEATINVD